MMCVERLSSHSHAHSHGHSHAYHSVAVKENSNEAESAASSVSGVGSMSSFMVGLLAHSAVDGIALGAVSAEGNAQSLSFLVFVALMAHKGPAVVSMTAFLKRKLSASLLMQLQPARDRAKATIVKQLVAFSAAAPVFAILTFVVLRALGFAEGSTESTEQSETQSQSDMLGYCLLFSGGTFLYVVTLHIIPEIKEWRQGGREGEHGSLGWLDLLILTVGCVVPSLFEHSH